MEGKMCIKIIIVFTCIIPLLLQVKCEGEHVWRESKYSSLIHILLTTRLSHCDVMIVRDEYFRNHPRLDWMWTVGRPIYTMSLNDSKDVASTFPQILVKANGQLYCFAMIIMCKSLKTCGFSSISRFIRNLDSHGIIRSIRRAVVYMEEDTVDTIRPPAKYISKKETQKSNLKTISKLSSRFRDLRIHVTLIRELVNMTKDMKWLLEWKGMPVNDSMFQILTWSLNWLPGGISPLLFDVWGSSTGFWNGGNVVMDRKDLKPEGETRIVVAGVKLLPFIRVQPNGAIQGFEAELIKIMQRKFKLKPVIFETEDRSYGQFLQNRWTGVVGYVARKEADIGLGSIAYEFIQRNADLLFSPPVILLEGSIACEYPQPLPSWKSIIFPFKIYVWMASVAGLVCVLIVFMAITVVELKIKRNLHKTVIVQKKSPSSTNWLLIFGPIFQRSMNLRRMSTLMAVRILYGIWLATTFLLSAAYCNILIGKFSVPEREAAISTLHDLLEGEKPWDIAFTIKNYLKNSVNTVETKVLNSAQDLNFAANMFGLLADNQALRNFLNRTRGCIVVERKRAKFFVHYFSNPIGNGFRKPPIRLSKETFYLGPAGWALRGDMDFILLYSLNRYVNAYREVGILRKAEVEFAPRPTTFKGEEFTNHEPLSKDVVGVTFLILFIGYMTSIIAFCMEHLKIYIDRRRKIRKLKHIALHYCK